MAKNQFGKSRNIDNAYATFRVKIQEWENEK